MLKRILVFILLGVYLVIPFRRQFLDSLHLISHISLHENPFHHHQTFHDHDHHHGLLERISITFEDEDAPHQLPEQALEFKFEQAFPSGHLSLGSVFPQHTGKLPVLLSLGIPGGPYFQVPTPPPRLQLPTS